MKVKCFLSLSRSLQRCQKVKVWLQWCYSTRWSSPSSFTHSMPSRWWAASTSRSFQSHDHGHRNDQYHDDDNDKDDDNWFVKYFLKRLELLWNATLRCTTLLPTTGTKQRTQRNTPLKCDSCFLKTFPSWKAKTAKHTTKTKIIEMFYPVKKSAVGKFRSQNN